MGLLQPLADGLKLFAKETVLPSNANIVLFVLAPIITFVLSLMGWIVIPFGEGAVVSDVNVGILYLFAISSLSVYGIITAGWSSNSKYPFLGALRSAAQMVSYEVSIGFIIVTANISLALFCNDIFGAGWEHCCNLVSLLRTRLQFLLCAFESSHGVFSFLNSEAQTKGPLKELTGGPQT